VHSCCGAPALRFDSTATLRVTGCRAREHVLRPPDGGSYGSLRGRGGGGGRRGWRDRGDGASNDGGSDGGSDDDGRGEGRGGALEEWEAAQWVLGVLRRHYSLVVEPYSHSPPLHPPRDIDANAAAAAAAAAAPPPPLGVDNGIFLAHDHYALGGVDVADEVAALGRAALTPALPGVRLVTWTIPACRTDRTGCHMDHTGCHQLVFDCKIT
jgi:hypothetical protein